MRVWDARWRTFAELSLYVLCFVGLALISRLMSFPNNFSAVWLPAGFALAVFASTSKKKWWLWILGSILSSLVFNFGVQAKEPAVVLGFTLANTSRTLLGAFLLQRWLPGRFRLNRSRDLLVFTASACLIAPLPTGLLGSLTLYQAYGSPWVQTFPTWYFGNVVGMMVVAPLTLAVLSWLKMRKQKRSHDLIDSPSSFARFVLLNAFLAASAIMIFRFSTAPVSFLVVPFMLWLIVRFELSGAGSGTFVLAVVILACTSFGYGPMAGDYPVATQMILSQLFVTTAGGCALLLATALQSSRRQTNRSNRAGARLAAMHRETQLILDTIPSMVIYKDASNRVLRLNRSAARWLGLAVKDVQGRVIDEVRPGPLGYDLADDREVIETGVPRLGHQEVVSLPDGEKRWVQTDKMPLPQQPGQEPRVLIVLTDMTERRRIEKELEQSNQDLEQFAIIASHDLKEPLRAVNGYCQFLKEDFGDSLDPQAIEYVDKAIQSADRMTQMINDLLEYSRVSRGDIEFHSVALNLIIEPVLKDLESRIQKCEATIEVGELPTVLGAESQLRQLFQNLLVNSLKFVNEGRGPRIRISAAQRGDFHVVSISDNGLGIDEKDQKRIFQIFQRLHRRSDYSGTGLGLAICDRIMQRHGGHIEVESALGQGAVFRLVFPKGH